MVPFTMYECMIPQCQAERRMRNDGLCILMRHGVYKVHRPNVKTTQLTYWEGGTEFVRTVHETPVGTLSTLHQPAGFTSWQREKMFKRPEDYKAILFFVQDECYERDYRPYAEAEQAFGDDAILRTSIPLEPLQELISGSLMRMEDFCIEWMDRRDEVLGIYDALAVNCRKLYPIMADSPASYVDYGGNVVPEIVGLENFRRYYVPHYEEAAEVLHAKGKLVGCHFDANCRLLAEAIAGTPLDYIEAFTPAPDTDMTLCEARAAWPDKVLWLNFPSSLHLRSDADVEAAAFEMVDQAGPDGIIMGITEDMPAHRWRDSCRAIMAGLKRHALARPALYL